MHFNFMFTKRQPNRRTEHKVINFTTGEVKKENVRNKTHKKKKERTTGEVKEVAPQRPIVPGKPKPPLCGKRGYETPSALFYLYDSDGNRSRGWLRSICYENFSVIYRLWFSKEILAQREYYRRRRASQDEKFRIATKVSALNIPVLQGMGDGRLFSKFPLVLDDEKYLQLVQKVLVVCKDNNMDVKNPNVREGLIKLLHAMKNKETLVSSLQQDGIGRGFKIPRRNTHKSNLKQKPKYTPDEVISTIGVKRIVKSQLNGANGEWTNMHGTRPACTTCYERLLATATEKTMRKYVHDLTLDYCLFCPPKPILKTVCRDCYASLIETANTKTKARYVCDERLDSCQNCPLKPKRKQVCMPCMDYMIDNFRPSISPSTFAKYDIIVGICPTCHIHKDAPVTVNKRQVCNDCWPILFEQPLNPASEKTKSRYERIIGHCCHCVYNRGELFSNEEAGFSRCMTLNGSNGEATGDDDRPMTEDISDVISNTPYSDKSIVCSVCTKTFVFDRDWQISHEAKNYGPPKKCTKCSASHIKDKKRREAEKERIAEFYRAKRATEMENRNIINGDEVITLKEYNQREEKHRELLTTIPIKGEFIYDSVSTNEKKINLLKASGYDKVAPEKITPYEHHKIALKLRTSTSEQGHVTYNDWKESNEFSAFIREEASPKPVVQEFVATDIAADMKPDDEIKSPCEGDSESESSSGESSAEMDHADLSKMYGKGSLRDSMDVFNAAARYTTFNDTEIHIITRSYEVLARSADGKKFLRYSHVQRIAKIARTRLDEEQAVTLELIVAKNKADGKDEETKSGEPTAPEVGHIEPISNPNSDTDDDETKSEKVPTQCRPSPISAATIVVVNGDEEVANPMYEGCICEDGVPYDSPSDSSDEDEDYIMPSSLPPKLLIDNDTVKVVLCNGFVFAQGLYYKRVETDNGAALAQYHKGDYGPRLLDKSYSLVQEGVILPHHVHDSGMYFVPIDEKQKVDDIAGVITVSPVVKIDNFVIEAREHRWFKSIREVVPDIINVMTFDALYKPDSVFARHTKISGTILIDMYVLSHLRSKYSAAAYSEAGSVLLRNSCETAFPNVPRELVAGTILYYVMERALTRRNDYLTTEALAKHIGNGRRTHMDPINNLRYNPVSGFDGLTVPGVYTFTSSNEAKSFHELGYTCVQRIVHSPSSSIHGTASNQVYKSNGRFVLDHNKSKNVTMSGAYLQPDANHLEHVNPDNHYNSFGGGFANGCAEVAVSQANEVALSMLRLTSEREGGSVLRQKQAILANRIRLQLDPSMELTNELNSRINDYKQSKSGFNMGTSYPRYHGFDDEDDSSLDINSTIDETMEPDPVMVKVMTSLAKLKSKSLLSLHDALKAEVEYEKSNNDYFNFIGVKLPERRRLLDDYVKNKPVDIGNRNNHLSKYNTIKAKKDEFQKIKHGELKFGRATVNISGMDLMEANPFMMYSLKHMLGVPIKIYNGTELGFSGVYVNYDNNVEFLKGLQIPRAIYMRTVIKETPNELLAVVIEEMLNYGRTYDDFVGFINHGDDMLIAERSERTKNCYDGFSWIEGDIEKNDSSYTHELLLLMYTYTKQTGIDVTPAFAQLAKDVRVNFNKNVHAVLENTQGMMLCSGSSMTTYLNSNGSSFIGLAYGLRKNVGISLSGAAADVGFAVTKVTGALSEMTFLSRGMYYTKDNKIKCFKCIASITRSFGHVHGDVLGSSRKLVSDRWHDHLNGVIASEEHEDDSMFMMALRTLDNRLINTPRKVYNTYRLKCKIKPNINRFEAAMSDLDMAIVHRYYGYEAEDVARGVREYVDLIEMILSIQDIYGKVIMSPFIDACMQKRYGLQAMCVA